MVTRKLDEALAARVIARHPVPIADATAALLAADSVYERRDRVVETFRATLRVLAGLALAARLQFGAGPGKQSGQLENTLRSLRSRGLTDGQWLSLLREVLRPWAKSADGHPLPHLVRSMHARKAPLPKLIDELLVIRKSETVAHGATGSRAAIERILNKRIPQLGELLELTDPLWSDTRFVLPLGGDDNDAEIWMGTTPATGRLQRTTLGLDAPPHELLLYDIAAGSPIVSLHPTFIVDEPSHGAPTEMFTLDRGGKKGAVFVAFPSMAERTLPDIWDALGDLFPAAADDGPDAATGRPFRGLQSFGADHADNFHGREQQAETLANRIRRVGMLTVTGPSGSGKTSLLQAGALPRIRALEVVLMRPGSAPLDRLVAALDAPDKDGVLDILATRKVALVVDQAEELITLCKDPEQRHAFGRLLARAASDGTTRVVIAVREDFFARLGAIDGLRDNYNREVEVVSTPDRDALARTVIAPLKARGFALEDTELVVAMVESVEEEPAALALLQFCADRLWDMRDRRWKKLTWDAYRSLGGVVGALATHADGVLEKLSPAQHAAARRMLLRLVTPARTRAVVAFDTLLEAGGEQGRAVVDRLVEERLVSLRETDGDAGPNVELVHEALIQHWHTLASWLSADEEGQRVAHALARAAEQWSERGRTRAALWRDDMLDDLRRWRRRAEPVLTDLELSFAGESEREQRRGRRIRRGLALGAAALTAAAAVVLFVLWRQALAARERAEVQRKRAEVQRNRAEVRGLVAQAREREPRGELAEAAALFRAAMDLQGTEGAGVKADIVRLSRSSQLGKELPGHGGPVWRVALSPNGQVVASASVDGTVRLWDVATGHLQRTLEGHSGIVEAILFSPDGATLLSASGSLTKPKGEVFSWDIETGRQRVAFAGHTAPVLRLAAGERWIASGSRDKTVRVWSTDGDVQHVLAHPKPITALAALGDEIVSASAGSVFVWGADSGELRHKLEGHGEGVVRLAVADHLASDPPRVVAGATRGVTRVWNAADGTLAREIPHPAKAVAISRDGNTVATGHADGLVRLWLPSTSPLSLRHHNSSVSVLRFSRDGTRLVTAAGSQVAVWNVTHGALVGVFEGHREVVHDVIMRDRLVVSGASDHALRLFELQPKPRWLRRRAGIVATDRVPGGKHDLIVWKDHALVRVGDETAAEVSLDGATTAALLDDDTWIAAEAEQTRLFSCDGEELAQWPVIAHHLDAAGGRFAFAHEGRITIGTAQRRCFAGEVDAARAQVSVDPTGSRVVARNGRSAELFNGDCSRGPTLPGHEANVTALGWSQDGALVVTGSRHTARIWDAATGASLHVLTGHKRTVTGVAVSPDKAVIATASLDNKVRLFAVDSGAIVATLTGHAAATRWLAFSSDGARLASADEGGSVRVWDVGEAKLIDRVSLGAGGTLALSLARQRLLTATRDGVAGVFPIAPLDPAAASLAVARRSNIRVCRDSQRPLAVVPFPTGDSPWAPAALCR